MELLAKLGVDWKLLLAQIVNFAILVGVLGFFVYRPLLDLLDARRDRIRRAMEDAKKIEEQTKALEEHRRKELQKIDQESGVMLEQTRREAEKVRQELLAAAERETEGLLAKGRRQLEEERSRVFHDVQGTLAMTIVQLTTKILQREFSDKDQERLLASLEKDIPTLLR